MFDSFYFYKYRFYINFIEDITLPEYKGSTLRGILGRTLLNSFCFNKHLFQDCTFCKINELCPYFILFNNNKYIPRPYVINPELSPKHKYSKGSNFYFELIIIGKVNKFLPYIVYSFEQIGIKGLKKHKGKYLIDKITIFDSDNKELIIYQNKILNLIDTKISFKDFVKNLETSTVTIKFQTPVRIKHNNKYINNFIEFYVLIKSLLNRINSLNFYYCDGNYLENLEKFISEAKDINIEHYLLKWKDVKRYSNRQKNEMFQGGLIGEITYSGNLNKYLPFLKLGEFINLGNFTTTGLGKYILEIT